MLVQTAVSESEPKHTNLKKNRLIFLKFISSPH